MSSLPRIVQAALAAVSIFLVCLGINAIIANIRHAEFNPNWIVLVVMSLITGLVFYFISDR